VTSAGAAWRPAGPTPTALHDTVGKAIAAEKRALKAVDEDPAKARADLESSLSELKDALAGAPAVAQPCHR
jgi:hypothetical protein